ncbi:type II toxin-antitoxin system RelE/ParE family toxin [Kumtagia ephedrae]|uniref:Type II toxin-antitoxin system mRNA interferase toxin, RelE/StbE family n=1 Tax=Kumtagia ephedrae TaxID=2116701 RepID=A0A2P7S9F6_9HYPH|nr:type II toxin-antitoxin system RelE/ParE family toxin [Mesorhizobium ephedrae]PSJ59128.1 type II toxin-antitoxin system mRNA interferase toxin, RelE/StbE family [Mesorhizobium ephedrae]
MKVRWSEDAEQDRNEIFDFIEADNPIAAAKMDLLFENAAERAAKFPHMGRPGELPGTRELIPHPSYRLVYEIQDDAIYVHAILHTARQWPPVLGEDN